MQQPITSISKAELDAAWPALQPAGCYNLSRSEAEALLRRFHPALDAKQAKALAGPGGTTTEKLEQLFTEDCRACDPDAAALAVMDPAGTGGVDMAVLTRLLGQLAGVKKVAEQDLAAVLAMADADGDGRVGLEDLHRLSRAILEQKQ